MTATQAEARARLERLPKAALWAIAARFKTVSLSQAPVLAGAWLAALAGGLRADVVIAAMVATAAIQIGTNLFNDAADAASGVDRADRLGPPRMTALGLLDGAAVHRGAVAAFGAASLAGAYLAMLGGWPVVLIGLLSLALGYFYSMGPFPLSGLPVGEAFVVAFFGVVAVSGTGWLMGVDPVAPVTLLTGLMIGLPAAAILMLNNHRDRAQDARAGRRTLAIVIGPDASRAVYCAFLLGALALGAAIAPSLWLAAPGALAFWLGVGMWRLPVSSGLNGLLGPTAAFQLILLGAVALG
jgi:1,4-dihydroxy-2-naphthoate octaprenyltransferase